MEKFKVIVVMTTLLLIMISAGLVLADGIYNSSNTPSGLPWNTYNYCNAPHVNAQHYQEPLAVNGTGAKLVYLNVVIRHHKRTPDNLFPSENAYNPASGWDCSDFVQEIYGGGTRQINRQTTIPSWHPYASTIWGGTCDAGQLTQQGLDDSVRHGKDFWSVYHRKLGFLKSVNPNDIMVRTSTELRTSQVAGGLLHGMDHKHSSHVFPVYSQPASIDSIVPSYSCPVASSIRDAYQSVPAWTDHLDANQDLKDRLDTTLGTAGLASWSSWYDHFFDAFTSRTCNGHPLPCNSTGSCVSQADADRVFDIGDFEYNYIWNAAVNSTTYVQLTFGVFFSELAQNFKSFESNTESYKLRFYVGHDGSMIRLAAGLGLGRDNPLRWPALGSEIVMEVWKIEEGTHFVRVLHEGTPVSQLDWVPLSQFVSLLDAQVPDNIYKACVSS